MVQLQEQIADFQDRNVSIAVIANQDAAELEAYREKAGLDFPILVDADASVIERFGLSNPQRKGLPHPATFVLDENGVVLYRRVDVDYRKRPEAGELLKVLDGR